MSDHQNRETANGHGVPPSLADDLRTVFYAFATRWLLIAIVMALCGGAGVVYLWTAKPAYVSTVRILVDPRGRQLTERDVVPSGLGSSSLGADSALVESQVEVLSSRSLRDRLIERENLLADPEFGGATGERSPLKALIRGILYGPNLENFNAPSPYDRASDTLSRKVDVGRIGNTYVLSVTVRTGSPEKSARLANAIGAIYMEDSQQAADASTEEAANALEERLAGLRDAANEAQREVEAYRTANGLVGVQGLRIDEQQLRNLNDQITVASIETERARARLEELRRLDGSPASRLARSNILSSTLAESLRGEIAAASAQEEIMRQTYGNRHPQLARAVQNRQMLESALTDEFRRIAGRAESDYQSAIAREDSLKSMLAGLEARQSQSNTAAVKLRELERDAASSNTVYENFLQRSKEAREQIDLPSVTARVISPAVPASQPSDPKLRTVLAVAAVAGLGLGAAIAWLLHLLMGTERKLPAPPRLFRLERRPRPAARRPQPAQRPSQRPGSILGQMPARGS